MDRPPLLRLFLLRCETVKVLSRILKGNSEPDTCYFLVSLLFFLPVLFFSESVKNPLEFFLDLIKNNMIFTFFDLLGLTLLLELVLPPYIVLPILAAELLFFNVLIDISVLTWIFADPVGFLTAMARWWAAGGVATWGQGSSTCFFYFVFASPSFVT